MEDFRSTKAYRKMALKSFVCVQIIICLRVLGNKWGIGGLILMFPWFMLVLYLFCILVQGFKLSLEERDENNLDGPNFLLDIGVLLGWLVVLEPIISLCVLYMKG